MVENGIVVDDGEQLRGLVVRLVPSLDEGVVDFGG